MNNVRYDDKGTSFKEDTFPWDFTPAPKDRFETLNRSPINEDNYLYSDENADRFNSPPSDPNQRHGQPQGCDPVSKEPVDSFESNVDADKAKEFFMGNLVSSFKNQDNLVDQIKQDLGGA